MQFFVTYCVMDGELANPFWHASLLLSYWPGEGSKIQVTNAWGFYGAPMSNAPGSWLARLKKKIRFEIDFQGSHGVFKVEEMRYLDQGRGLLGMTFEISLDQFARLKIICREKIAVQEQAIAELKQRLASGEKAPSSYAIFQEEKRLAQEAGRKPRLEPFDFHVSLGMYCSISLNNSHTCKGKAISLLREIGIAEAQLDKLTLHNSSTAIPRSSGQLEPVFLHSTGPEHQHTSRAGKISFFRQWEDREDKLFWTLPPQLLATESRELSGLTSLPRAEVNAVRKLIAKLQKIEHEVMNIRLNGEDETMRLRLRDYIRGLYEGFAVVNTQYQSAWKECRTEAESFLNCLYFAIVDEWDDDSEIETVAGRFPASLQEKICQILGRPLVKENYLNLAV